MASDDVKINNGFFEELSRSPRVSNLCREVAVNIAAVMISTAPDDSGAYKRRISVKRKFQKRVVWLVIGGDRKTMIIESKTGNMVRALNTVKRRRRG